MREGAGARLVESWEHGFPRGSGPVLAVLEHTYRRVVAARERLYARGWLTSRGIGCPVVSVGNLTVGGTGKTPATELAVQTLARLGHRPAVVSRGYRRRSRGIMVVADSASIRLEPEEAGDEPFLLARRLPGVPVVVGASRHAAAQVAIRRFGVTAIVMDDGFQHRTLAKDLEIVMVRARCPAGNGCLLPRGPLREPLSALARADLVVASGAESEGDLQEVRALVGRHAPGVPVLAARYRPVECWEARGLRPRPPAELAGRRLLAFAGIAAPDGFARTLASLGVETVGVERFGNHHWYRADELEGLARRAAAVGAEGLVTTEKDWVRLRHLAPPACPLHVMSVRLELVTGHERWQAAFAEACPAP